MVAGHLQQVRADRVEAVVAGQPLVGVQGLQQVESGPAALAPSRPRRRG